jgi:hypothetical protein
MSTIIIIFSFLITIVVALSQKSIEFQTGVVVAAMTAHDNSSTRAIDIMPVITFTNNATSSNITQNSNEKLPTQFWNFLFVVNTGSLIRGIAYVFIIPYITILVLKLFINPPNKGLLGYILQTFWDSELFDLFALWENYQLFFLVSPNYPDYVVFLSIAALDFLVLIDRKSVV